MSEAACSPQADEAFGPRVVACRQGFDFTLLFEQIILTAIPSALVLLTSSFFLFRRLKNNVKTRRHFRHPLKWAKLAAIICLAASQLVLVVLWTFPGYHPTSASLPAMIVSLFGTLAMGVLSYLEHERSVRPSSILCIYLLLSAVLDLGQARTLWLRGYNDPVASVFTVALLFKVVSLVAEMWEKRPLLAAPYRDYPPEALGGIVNRSVFWWLNSLLRKGLARELNMEDLFGLDQDLTSVKLHAKFQRAWTSTTKRNSWYLFWISLSCFWRPLLASSFSRLLLAGLRLSQPLLIDRAVSLLSEPESQDQANTGRALIGATALLYLGIAVTTGQFSHNSYRLITMIRGGLVCLIYDETLHLDAGLAHESAALTLMATDIDCIIKGIEMLDALWAGPIEIAVGTYMLYSRIGPSSAATILLLTAFIATCLSFGKLISSAQTTWVEAIQRRVAATASALASVKAVKMTGLSRVFHTLLGQLRADELHISRRFRMLYSITAGINNLAVTTISTTTLVVYVLVARATTGFVLDSALAFTLISLVSLIASPISQMAQGIPRFAAAAGCFYRIQLYLEASEKPHAERESLDAFDVADKSDTELQTLAPAPGAVMSVQSATFGFKSATQPILFNINLHLAPGSFTMPLGPVGSGKSALLLALLGEMRITKGSLHKHPRLQLAYCAQDPWLPNVTIRRCITGSSDYDQVWYSDVLEACALNRDLESLPQRDDTLVGSNGVALSGGQRQRISLARALYSRRQVLLLDDILSGLDATTEQWIVERVLGKNGICRQYGATIILATHSVRHVARANNAIIMAMGGTISKQGPPHTILSMKDRADGLGEKSSTLDDHADKDLLSRNHHGSSSVEQQIARSELSRQVGDMRLYAYYMRALGWTNIGLVCLADTIFAFFIRFPTLWLDWWSHAEMANPGAETDRYMGIYGLFSAICCGSFLVVLVLLLHVGMPRSSLILHRNLLNTVIAAPYWFFVSTDSGQILNRFSQDMALIHMQLPFAFLDTVFLLALCIIESAFIAASSRWSLPMFPVLILVLYVLQRFYLRTSRQLRLLELESKSPLYSQFGETLRGLSTVRAFGWQNTLVQQNYAMLDESQKPFYLLYAIQRWLGFVLDCVVAIMASVIMSLATQIQGSSAGALGVSLVNLLTFSQGLTYLLRSWVELETSLGAVARVKSFEEETPSEYLPNEQVEPGYEWPMDGSIQVQNVVASYRSEGEPVLRGISINIKHGQKIGICGRTGSGKSSFVLSLLKVIEMQSGDILIGGQSIKDMPREVVRRRLTVMPQEPLLLPGTIRFNVDPWSEHSDAAIESALGEVGLRDIVANRGGLDTEISACPLSRGQEQLLCLARALLGRSQVLILDEATSNLDASTEEKIMEVVARKFADKTVIMIAHRLNIIQDFDTVMVLEKGSLSQWGSPRQLIEQPGIFQDLWNSRNQS